MVGRAISVSMMTEAPTMPVVAAMMVPIKVTDMARPPGHAAREHLQRLQEFVGDARFLQDRSHEDEHRHCDQHRVLDRLTEDARHQAAELGRPEHLEHDAEGAERQRDAAQDEGDRIAHEHDHREHEKHQNREVIANEFHDRPLASRLRLRPARRRPRPDAAVRKGRRACAAAPTGRPRRAAPGRGTGSP